MNSKKLKCCSLLSTITLKTKSFEIFVVNNDTQKSIFWKLFTKIRSFLRKTLLKLNTLDCTQSFFLFFIPFKSILMQIWKYSSFSSYFPLKFIFCIKSSLFYVNISVCYETLISLIGAEHIYTLLWCETFGIFFNVKQNRSEYFESAFGVPLK